MSITSPYHITSFFERNSPFSGRTISDFRYFPFGISAVNHAGEPDILARSVFLYSEQHTQRIKLHLIYHVNTKLRLKWIWSNDGKSCLILSLMKILTQNFVSTCTLQHGLSDEKIPSEIQVASRYTLLVNVRTLLVAGSILQASEQNVGWLDGVDTP